MDKKRKGNAIILSVATGTKAAQPPGSEENAAVRTKARALRR